MTTLEAVNLSNALLAIEDKNKITSKEVRMAVINNVISLITICEDYHKKQQAIEKEFVTEEIKELEQERMRLIEEYNAAEKGSIKKKELFAQIEVQGVKLSNLYAPRAEEKQAAYDNINNEAVTVSLQLVKPEDFDNSTQSCKLSIKDMLNLRMMFITESKLK